MGEVKADRREGRGEWKKAPGERGYRAGPTPGDVSLQQWGAAGS